MRLLIHVEGETEESFVNELLRPHLYDFGFTGVSARLLGNARLRSRRGGITSWQTARREIARHLQSDTGSYAATLVDYYALPATGPKAWPGREGANDREPDQRGRYIAEQLNEDIIKQLPQLDPRRFIPCILMHEFEGLLFSDCQAFAAGIDRADLAPNLQEIRDSFETPEDIDDSPQTAPSKRIQALLRGYQKPLFGVLGALEIGLETMRRECPNFRHWLERLEGLEKI